MEQEGFTEQEFLKNFFIGIGKVINLQDKVVTNYREYDAVIPFLDYLDLDPEKQYIRYNTNNDSNPILTVKRPEFTEAPPLPEVLQGWVTSSWTDYHEEPKQVPFQKLGESAVSFEADPRRVRAWDEAVAERQKWADEQKKLAPLEEFYQFLSKLCVLQRQGENDKELVFAFGLFENRPQSSPRISHPLYTQKVRVSDQRSKDKILEIYEAVDDVEAETSFLENLQDGSIHQVAQVSALWQQYAPQTNKYLEEETAPLLKDVLSKLTSQGSYYTQAELAVQNGQWGRNYHLSYSPMLLYRKESSGIKAFLDRILEDIKEKGKAKPHLIDVLHPKKGGAEIAEIPQKPDTPEKRLRAISGEDEEILLTKPANKQQLSIAQEIRQKNAVEVQGPPGTGKTHTIANLIGDLLAQGKSVLVTSEKVKALTVLRDKLDPKLQAFCLPVFEDNQRDMMDAIQQLQAGLAQINPDSLQREIVDLTATRKELLAELEKERKRIFALRCQQSKGITYLGKDYSLIELGKKLADEESQVFHFPMPFKETEAMPITEKDYQEWVESEQQLSVEEEKELAKKLPEITSFVRPEVLREQLEQETNLQQREAALASIDPSLFQFDWENEKIYEQKTLVCNQGNMEKVPDLLRKIEELPNWESWQETIIENVRLGEGYASRWNLAADALEGFESANEAYARISPGKHISFGEGIDFTELPDCLDKIGQELQGNGKLGFFFTAFHKNATKYWKEILINGKTAANVEDVRLIKGYLQVHSQFEELKNIWNDCFAGTEMPELTEIQAYNSFQGKQILKQIREALQWNGEWLETLLYDLEAAGFSASVLRDKLAGFQKTTDIGRYLQQDLKELLTFIKLETDHHDFQQLMEGHGKKFRQYAELKSAPIEKMLQALQKQDCTAYDEAYHAYEELLRKRPVFAARRAIYQRVKETAPAWAEQLAARKAGIQDLSYAKLCTSWEWSQLNLEMDKIFEEPLEGHAKKVEEYSALLRKKTADLASKLAWFRLHEKINGNQQISSSLSSWATYIKRAGKMTGKYAKSFLRQARENMKTGQEGIPVWVMPIRKALQTLDPRNNHFDVVIIDEASQSALEAIPVSYLGDKVIVVGDDKQVSPLRVGQDSTAVRNILQMYLKPYIKNWDLYDGRTSYYELVRQVFTPILLREHFRCVPEIIGYSNKFFYDGQIIPLRDSHSSKLLPPVINYRVDGKRNGRQPVNQTEADTIVSLILACFEQKEYEGKTFGVISLLGPQQGELIQQTMMSRIPDYDELKSRQFFAGTSQQFQGDERDVIFISLVDDPDSVRTVSDSGAEKRYNVAVSRARDQLWVVHSLNQDALNPSDLKFGLLNYASHYESFMKEQLDIKKKADSPFEVEVANYLLQKGYLFIQQYQVGAYSLDFAILYQKKMVALECDGERYHSSDTAVEHDMERQAILQRLGWKFVRIRGGAFYRDKETAMESVYRQLDELRIYPGERENPDVPAKGTELFERVKRRAAEIREEWKRGIKPRKHRTTIEVPKEKPVEIRETNVFTGEEENRKEEAKRPVSSSLFGAEETMKPNVPNGKAKAARKKRTRKSVLSTRPVVQKEKTEDDDFFNSMSMEDFNSILDKGKIVK